MKTIIAILTFLTVTVSASSQTVEDLVVKKTNALRAQIGGTTKGLAPFVRNSSLDSAAMYHARWVVASGIGSHTETKPVKGIVPLATCADRAAKYGVTAFAENLIAWSAYSVNDDGKVLNSVTAEKLMTLWKNSPGHLANLLSEYSSKLEPRIGIAICQYDQNYFCIVMIIGSNVDANGQLIK